MLHEGEPTVARIARAGAMSVRSLQRRLAEEGTSYSEQLEIVRRNLADALLLDHDASLEDVSVRLGFSGQSVLSRAIRRWTGATPSSIRKQAAS